MGRIATNCVYRLPTEAEWEYGCRAGTTTRISFGDALGCDEVCEYCALFDSYMRWCGNEGPDRVGQKSPNPWGLYDMHGNAVEWCQDLFAWEHPEYHGGTVVDP
ncbi:MAG: formylglycine-generating enzyme family protein [Verrucomicrobiia bacterium]